MFINTSNCCCLFIWSSHKKRKNTKKIKQLLKKTKIIIYIYIKEREGGGDCYLFLPAQTASKYFSGECNVKAR